MEPATETMTFAPADPYAVQAERFARAVMDDDPLPIPTADALGNMQVIDEIFGGGRLVRGKGVERGGESRVQLSIAVVRCLVRRHVVRRDTIVPESTSSLQAVSTDGNHPDPTAASMAAPKAAPSELEVVTMLVFMTSARI